MYINELTNSELLLHVLDFTPGNIFVTDKYGKLIYVNGHCASSFGMDVKQLLSYTAYELISEKIIDRSLSVEVMEKKQVVIGRVETRTGAELYSICRPVFDENNEIKYIVTCGQTKEVMEQYLDVIDEERVMCKKYKDVIAYYNEKESNCKIIIRSQLMKNLFSSLENVIKTDSTVMLYGESGVGKDVVAKYIHHHGLRRNEPLIPINCSAIPSELMESEFFGYEKGAFTGASPKGKPGLFEISDKGTLFLDEVAELPPHMQTKLLRAIESKEILRLGGTTTLNIDVRIITATNKDLRSMVEKGQFREDLFYRLNVVPITIPPLRARVDDIEPLANFFLEGFNKKYGLRRRFSDELIVLFQQCEWNGNIRELKNIVERLVITSDRDILTVSHFHNMNISMDPRFSHKRPPQSKKTTYVSLNDKFDSVLKEKVLDLMLEMKGNKKAVATHLGVSRGKLYRILNGENASL